MRLVTQTEALAPTFGDEQAVRMLAKAGFDAIDWSFFYMTDDTNVWNKDGWREHALHLKAVAEECGIGFSQAHAPFPTSKGDALFDAVMHERILRSIEAAALMGVKNIVVHPRHHIPHAKHKAQLFEENVELYRGLIPYCEQFGIRVCCENMWQFDRNRNIIIDSACSQPEEFCTLLDAIDSPWIVGCLDIGHCALVGVDPADFIRALGAKRLQALHVHDVDHLHDCHTLPYMQKLDWNSITAALADIEYTGDLTFEADEFLRAFPPELRQDASILMERTGRHLIRLIETHKG